VEIVERAGRIGPRRMYAPSYDHVSEGYQDRIRERVEDAHDREWLDAHPADVRRVLELMDRPTADAFSVRDANIIQTVVSDAADAYEREGNAMAMQAGEDEELKALAADNQDWASRLRSLAAAFDLLRMDTVEDTEDANLYIHDACGAWFTDRFKYSKHCGMCDAEESGNKDNDA
jgi:hypothetical protein